MAFLDDQIGSGVRIWQDAWHELRHLAQKSHGEKLIPLGSEGATLRNTTKATSKGLEEAIEYHKDGGHTSKTISREDFRRQFQKGRTLGSGTGEVSERGNHDG